MQTAEILARLNELRPQFHAEGVSHLSIFGSRARGDFRPDSDLDLLLEVPAGSRFSILNLIGVEHLVTDRLGIKANATMRRGMRDRLVAAVGHDIVDVF